MINAQSLFLLVVLGLLISLPGPAVAQNPADASDHALDDATKTRVINALIEKIDKYYVLPDVAQKMAEAIRTRQAKKEYASITSGKQLAAVLTDHLRQICHDGHLGVDYFPDGIPYDAEKPPSPDVVKSFRESGRRANYQFRKVERLDGAVGLLQIDGFYPGEWIGDTLAGAMSFLSNSDAVIIDLRWNHGGFGNGTTLLCSYFFEEETHLADDYNRPENNTRQIWTFPVAPSARMADKELYILTSSGTFSAPEWVAYNMQALKRATIVGETTGGGAHGTTPYRLDDHFSASIPFNREINPITKTDWEGVGVKPDVAVPANQALLTAHLMALKAILKKHDGDKAFVDQLTSLISAKEKELAALRAGVTKP